MSKKVETKTKKKQIVKEKEVKEVKKVHKVEIEDEEELAEDVKVALGMKKAPKSKIHEIDYIAELENGLDDFGIEETPKHNFDDEFDLE